MVWGQQERTLTNIAVETLNRVAEAMRAAQDFLLRAQADEGYWCAELEGDTILESEYILTMHFLGRRQEERVRKAANYLRRMQLAEGGWSIYPGGPPDVSASVKAYFALKLVGDSPDAEHMQRARQVILRLGGVDACNTFTKIYLAIFGQYPWDKCPAVPPEMILLPNWFYFNIYEMSAWSRAIIVPLSVMWACKPFCPVPEHAHIKELFTKHQTQNTTNNFWRNFFSNLDLTIKRIEGKSYNRLRERALKACEEWMLKRFEKSDGLGAIFPPIVNSIFALHCLGYPLDHPVVQKQVHELEKLEIEEGDTIRIQPCFSAVWDTALTMNSLLESGLPPDHPAILKAARWLLDKEVKEVGDWKVKNPEGEPGGWFFEFNNEFYPDCDDTAQVLISLSKVRFPNEDEEQRRKEVMERALKWLLSMQNKDGGWASFDKGCDKQVLTQIPFADHNAMIDPSTDDITARALEALACLGFDRKHPVVRRALKFLWRAQEKDGSWYGRWGCNHLYGTWLALRGMKCIGEDMRQKRLVRAANWIRSCQNEDGGWGELPRSYQDPCTKGMGPSTASQTAWALMGLFAAGDYQSRSVQRGIEYLLSTQREDGSWRDDYFTGTGFPKVFYLRYHFYATYFPLLALSLYERFWRRAMVKLTAAVMLPEKGAGREDKEGLP